MVAWLRPSSPTPLCASLSRAPSAVSVTTLPFQRLSSNSSLVTTRSRFSIKQTSKSKTTGSIETGWSDSASWYQLVLRVHWLNWYITEIDVAYIRMTYVTLKRLWATVPGRLLPPSSAIWGSPSRALCRPWKIKSERLFSPKETLKTAAWEAANGT